MGHEGDGMGMYDCCMDMRGSEAWRGVVFALEGGGKCAVYHSSFCILV